MLLVLLMIGVQLFDSWIYVISGIATTGSLVTVGKAGPTAG